MLNKHTLAISELLCHLIKKYNTEFGQHSLVWLITFGNSQLFIGNLMFIMNFNSISRKHIFLKKKKTIKDRLAVLVSALNH